MSDDITTGEILHIINERDKHTQEKLIDIMAAQKETENTLKKVCDHIIINEEHKRQDSEFKKETRAHIKFAEPILNKAKEVQESRAKLFVYFCGLLIAAFFAAFVNIK